MDRLTHTCFSFFQSFCPFVLLSLCLPVFISTCRFVILSFCLSVLLSFCPSVLLSFCPSVLLSFCPSVLLSFCPSVLLSFCPSVLPSFCPFVLLSFLYLNIQTCMPRFIMFVKKIVCQSLPMERTQPHTQQCINRAFPQTGTFTIISSLAAATPTCAGYMNFNPGCVQYYPDSGLQNNPNAANQCNYRSISLVLDI
jgi:hypothetical protein